ncbi:MAG: Endonuclease YhcR precursor [bacterium ADurb.Bin363]|nr:MAG: Endonuclease YhcR precursor [bacterium ADurb.Bin363]
MKINRTDFIKNEYIKTDKGKKSEETAVKDSVILSSGNTEIPLLPSSSQEIKTGKSVPMTITLDIGGKETQKKIMGQKTDKELILNMKHTNDIHGNMPFVSTLIEPDEFWVDAGDAFQGYRFHSIISGGREENDLMNLRDCDLATTGNHFYDYNGTWGGNFLIEKANFPYISANTKGLAPYAIAEVEGVKLAFIGVRTTEKKDLMVDPSKTKDLEITDPVEALEKSVSEVRAKGVKNIIVLSHLGLEPTPAHPNVVTDKEIAKKIPGIDLIIGGHTHTPTKEKVEVNGTRIVHAGIEGKSDVATDDLYLGQLSLKIDRSTGKITSIDHKLIQVDRSKPVDEDVKAIRNKYLMEEDFIGSQKLGIANTSFTHKIKTPVDSALGNLVTDAIRKSTEADVAVLDSNFFATSREDPPPSVLSEGEITMKGLTETSLWMGKALDASVETWNVPGETIKKLLEDGVNKLLSSKKTEGLYQVSGLTMRYDTSRPEGNRVTEIFIGEEPLLPDKNYRFTTSYIQGNWNPLFAGRDEASVEDGLKIRNIVADSIRDKIQINSAEEKRICPA